METKVTIKKEYYPNGRLETETTYKDDKKMELQNFIMKVENYNGKHLVKMTKEMELQKNIMKVENYEPKYLL